MTTGMCLLHIRKYSYIKVNEDFSIRRGHCVSLEFIYAHVDVMREQN